MDRIVFCTFHLIMTLLAPQQYHYLANRGRRESVFGQSEATSTRAKLQPF